jgi:MFS family permease
MTQRWSIRRLALGLLLSGVGSWAAGISVSYYVFRETGSAVWVAGTLFFTFGVAGFFSPLAGKIADRYDRRLVMIVADLSAAVCWFSLIWVRDPAAVIAVAFVGSVVGMPYHFAAMAAIPNLAGEEGLGWANGLLSAASSVSRLIGPAFGGALFAFAGIGAAFAVNALSFVLSAVMSASIRHVPFSSEERTEAHTSVWDGFRAVFRDDVRKRLLIAWAISYLAMDIAFVADPPLAAAFGVGAFGYGLMDTVFGGGAAIGGLYARRVKESAERRWIILGLLGVAAGWALIAGAPLFVLVLIPSAVAAAMDTIGTVAGYSVIQRRTPDELRGRVFAAYAMTGMIANMIGFILVGPFVEAYGPRAVYLAGGVLSLLAAGVFVYRRPEIAVSVVEEEPA